MIRLTMSAGVVLTPRRIDVREVMNQPFVVRIVATSPDADLPLDDLIGTAVTVELSAGPRQRTYRGCVFGLTQLRAEFTGLSSYALEVGPALALLGLGRDYRCFQAMSEPAIALELLRLHGIPVTSHLDLSTYPRRELRVQYGESDLAFVGRLLEAAGIAYWFEHHEGVTTMVLADTPSARAPSRTLREVTEGIDVPAVDFAQAVEVRRALRPGVYTVYDVDFRRKATEQPAGSARAADGAGRELTLERFHYLPGAMLAEAAGGDTPVADERIAVRSLEAEGDRLAARRLSAKRADARRYRFRTDAIDVKLGETIAVTGDATRLRRGGEPLLVVGLSLTGEGDGRWMASVDARPTSVPYRPPLVTPRPRADSVESAIVVCPEGEEIHTDEFGRVRIHFPWDRGPVVGGAWVPVSQPWAGAGFGAINLPRAGQEVLVQFRGGDPDQPVITGRTFTALAPVPYPLPENKTQSGWKSSSTGETGGYNELMLEDAAGRELVRMQAERDLVTDVRRDERREVDNDRTARVGRHDVRTVKRDQVLSVGGRVVKVVAGSSDSLVGRDATRLTRQGYRSTVATALYERTGANASSFVDGDDAVTVVGKHTVTASTRATFKVGAASVEMDGEAITLKSGGGAVLTLKPDEIHVKCDHMTLSAKEIVGLTGTTVTHLGGAERVHATGHAMVAASASLILIKGGGRPFSRLLEPSPDKIKNGSTSVQVPE